MEKVTAVPKYANSIVVVLFWDRASFIVQFSLKLKILLPIQSVGLRYNPQYYA